MTHFVFGQNVDGDLSRESLLAMIRDAQRRTTAFADTPIESIVGVLDRVGTLWHEGSPFWNRAFEITRQELSFSDDMIRVSLNIIPELLSAQSVIARLKSDFDDLRRLDTFVESRTFQGRDRAFPLGVLFHVSAGNVFLGAIDSLLMGFLTKNISIVKLSSRNLSFPRLFAESIAQVDSNRILVDRFALIHFAGGRTDLEQAVKESVNAIIAWGGEDMITSYKKSLPMGLKFIEYGPKISFQVVTKQGLEAVGTDQAAQWIAQDVSMWDQAACASPQNLFLEDGIDVSGFLKSLGEAFSKFPLARGRLSDDECVEILKERARAEYDQILEQGALVEGKDFLIHFESTPGIRPSPLNRSLVVKSFRDQIDLTRQLSSLQRHLQSCGFLLGDAEKDSYLCGLGGLGVMRFAALGQVMRSPIGAPHDGKKTLLELTRLVPEETDGTIQGLVNESIAHVPFYKALRQGRFVQSLSEMPLISGSDLDTGTKETLAHFTHDRAEGGYLFSSGGTSGAPKYSLYSHAEFSRVAALLARGFMAQGMRAGSVVANFFVAGNMWSSFLAVDQALAVVGARVLPIGGMTDRDLTLGYLEQFKPDFLIGLPTQILELTRRAEEKGARLSIPNVLYAGEHLSLVARQFIQKVFHTTHFGSAGYASVDAGPIGYQCRHCDGGLHHLFAEDVHLEIIDGEAIVTSLVKRQMPVIRLKTGDLVEWATQGEPCACGSSDRMFRLHGRANSQFNLWGCRMFLQEIEYALADCAVEGAHFQVLLSQDAKAQDFMTVRIEHERADHIDVGLLADRIHALSKDLRATHPRRWLDGKLKIEACPIERVARTGKIKPLIDERMDL